MYAICCAFTERRFQVAIERNFKLTEYNRSIKAEAIYDAGLLNCARLYSSSGDHSFSIYYSRLHPLLILGIISQMRALVIDNRVGDMVRIY